MESEHLNAIRSYDEAQEKKRAYLSLPADPFAEHLAHVCVPGEGGRGWWNSLVLHTVTPIRTRLTSARSREPDRPVSANEERKFHKRYPNLGGERLLYHCAWSLSLFPSLSPSVSPAKLSLTISSRYDCSGSMQDWQFGDALGR